MTGLEHDHPINALTSQDKESDRRIWLIVTSAVVLLILAAGIFLASRANDDADMPGMDMGSEAPAEGSPTTIALVPDSWLPMWSDGAADPFLLR